MNIEILAPAGDKEKLETAFYFGADACYFAGKKWGLRAFSENFDENELKNYIEYAHKLGKKCYITVNIQAHNSDFDGLSDYLKYLYSIKADAIIVSDAGILSLAKQVVPNLDVHISTQASASNKYSAKFWADAGAKRIILARELSLKEIKEIRDYLPKDIELEAFCHGAMCISYSGRCLLSNYLAGRDSNRGQCVQACRWEYKIREVSRDGDELEIQEDERGTYILNSKDLCMIEHLDEMLDAGITSFKIEGRMKSPFYVATVVNAYKRAFEMLKKDRDEYKKNCHKFVKELENCSHRKFTTGFCLGENDREYLKTSMPVSSSEFMAIVTKETKDGYCEIEQRNRFKIGDELEVLSPGENFLKKVKIEELIDEKGNQVLDALKVQQRLKLKTSLNLKEKDILRRTK
ncbi:MAG: U32 family peptidase [Clostridia bacterium]|nr:U32 family peptidase [Clostridia bacterium]